ncbi:hypothetical protein ACFQ4C_30120 [Larkinella insperata]|uniref:Uncharacterized protein n=1 Tax=Larkinella insperata TaxID=332158 RepID=A0ABW3QGW7_9BACT
MKDHKLYQFIDRELEKLAMLWSIEEGLFGLYQLFEDINRYSFLTIADKYAIVYDLLNEIILEELATLEEFTDAQLTTKVKDVELVDISLILDNPRSWDVNAQPTYSLCLTSKGEQYMDSRPNELKQLEERSKLF